MKGQSADGRPGEGEPCSVASSPQPAQKCTGGDGYRFRRNSTPWFWSRL
jgi:hypothetical protein